MIHYRREEWERWATSLSAVLGAFLVLYQSAPSARDKYSRKFIRFTNLQSCTIIKYSSSTTHVRFESDLNSTLPVLIRILSTDHVGIKYRSSLDRDWFIRLMCPYNGPTSTSYLLVTVSTDSSNGTSYANVPCSDVSSIDYVTATYPSHILTRRHTVLYRVLIILVILCA